ncbi:sensor histidine kinase [Budvicia aquatica]|uniref:sensor histidine kinase n=1 Tax=Budvicia aquatica TaxID=82979 RepID=UPI002088CD0C|nr:sensor histidine kinase [Budvicia aquatica]GKX52895.1 sensor histidine kinase [Budvicia aquatica]
MAGYIKSICLILLLYGANPVFAAEADPEQPSDRQIQIVDVGILATRGDMAAIARWQPLMDWLDSRIPQTRFQLHPYSLDQMATAVKTQSVDFIITNPGQSVQLGRQYSLSWLATLRSPHQGGTGLAIGSAFVVRATSPYQHIQDLKGRPVAAVSEMAFGGYLTLKREMQQAGIDPTGFFSAVDFSGFPLDAIIYKLRDGGVEGVILPVCQLEDMVRDGLIAQQDFRVLNNQAPEGFGCQTSTRLYPNWSFAKTGKAPEALAKQVSRALLALPEDHPAAKSADSLGWTTPISQLVIDKLYQDLDLHPWQNPWWKEALVWLKVNQQWGWLLVILIVVLNAYHFLLEYRFNQNQKRLLKTQSELNEKIAMLEHAQRVAIVGELGASIAHEISQPLAAIQNYSHGGLVRIQKGHSAADLQPVLENIKHQVTRASEIVQRLRGLINKRATVKVLSDIPAIVNDTLLLLKHESERRRVQMVFSVEGQPRLILVDPVGFQQLILNIVKNGMDACTAENARRPLIEIQLAFRAKDIVVRVADNGKGLDAPADTLQSAFYSTKDDGLGLGLAICTDVVKSHHGVLTMNNRDTGGCIVEILLPANDADEQREQGKTT